MVGLHPDARGSGLGLALTVTGLAHLASLGLAVVILYADETNAGAVRMYQRLGFETHHTDVEYARSLGRQSGLGGRSRLHPLGRSTSSYRSEAVRLRNCRRLFATMRLLMLLPGSPGCQTE